VAPGTNANNLRVVNSAARNSPVSTFVHVAHLTLISGIDMLARLARLKNIVMTIDTTLIDTIMRKIGRHPRHARAVARIAFFGSGNVVARLPGRRHAVMAGFAGLVDGGVIHPRRYGKSARRVAGITWRCCCNVTRLFTGCTGTVMALIALPGRAAKRLINMAVFARDTLVHPFQRKPG